jgi:hypothetical protein
MTIKNLSYKDIPAAKRKAAASRAATQIRESLNNPSLTAEQTQQLRDRLTRLDGWAKGTLPDNPGKVLAVVTVSETVTVKGP